MDLYQTKNQSIIQDTNKTTLKVEQAEKDSGVFDRLSENYSVFRTGLSSQCPSDCLRLQVSPSPNTTTSSAYSSVTSSCFDSTRRQSEVAARLGQDSALCRVPHHPVVTGFSNAADSTSKNVVSLAVPSVLSHRSRGDSANSTKSDQATSEDSRFLNNVNTNKIYEKKRLLGKGGFARVYEVSEVVENGRPDSEATYAAKIINKSRIPRPHQREKVDHEVELMNEARGHPNVVNLLDSFEDENSIYILLELCKKKSLAQYLKRKQWLNETEVFYIMNQIVSGLSHLHGKGIIHRDLKLGNILLTENMQVKIGDFGLATRLDWERKKTICGTPNFIAPEVLQRLGHGLEADIWALGCLMYTLLVGKPPFEMPSLRETYRCIMKNSYRMPSTLSAEAADLIQSMLRHKAKARPTISEVSCHEFFLKHRDFVPSFMPKSSSSSFPRKSSNIDPFQTKQFEQLSKATTPMSVQSQQLNFTEESKERNRSSIKVLASRVYRKFKPVKAVATVFRDNKKLTNLQQDETTNFGKTVVNKHNIPRNANCTPTFVNKWVDYSNRYGFGCQLSNGKICVLVNDGKHISILPNGNVEYVSNETSKPICFPVEAAPEAISGYVTILENFAVYMDRNLFQNALSNIEENDAVRLVNWNRTDEYVAMYFSDGTLQINFTRDHVKVNISLHNSGTVHVIIVDAKRQKHIFSEDELSSNCSPELAIKLDDIHNQLHFFQKDTDCSSHRFCKILAQLKV